MPHLRAFALPLTKPEPNFMIVARMIFFKAMSGITDALVTASLKLHP